MRNENVRFVYPWAIPCVAFISNLSFIFHRTSKMDDLSNSSSYHNVERITTNPLNEESPNFSPRNFIEESSFDSSVSDNEPRRLLDTPNSSTLLQSLQDSGQGSQLVLNQSPKSDIADVIGARPININNNSSSSNNNNNYINNNTNVNIFNITNNNSKKNVNFSVRSKGSNHAPRQQQKLQKSKQQHQYATNNSTSRNLLDISGHFASDVIMSVVEGRGKARGEIGLAYIDLHCPIVHLSQFRDNCSFDSLKMKCHVCVPSEIIFPHTLTENNMMLSSLVESFANIDFKPFDRRFFNEKQGFEFVQTLCYKDYTWIDIELESKYYCLSACSALLHYISTKNIQYAAKSMKIVYKSSVDTMIIDPTSVKILELLINLSNPKSSDTLFGVINRTKTKSGHVLLRSSILQPSTDLNLIMKRLDMVEAISSSIEHFNNFEMILTNFSSVDMDQLLVNLVQSPCVLTSESSHIRFAERKIELVIHMKHAISLVDPLRQALERCDASVFADYIDQLRDPDFVATQKMIDQVINSETKCAKGNANMRLEKCFAIKDRFSVLLDLARGIYSDTIDDIIALVRAYETKFQMDSIKIAHSNSKGFFLQIKCVRNQASSALLPPNLPQIFREVSVTKTHIAFTSDDLIKLNNRINAAVEEIYLQSDSIMTQLIHDIRSKISCFYALTDIVANVDLYFSFAYQCSCSNYVRPNFGDYIEIRNGVHPVLERIAHTVPNSVLINNDLNFHIITGPNMSGKTTFLKQIALLQIMAQIGSFVPAEQASFRICDKLFTRMGLNDNLQMNSSSFMVEVKELNYILNNLIGNRLILIDELGRGSVFNETLSICWAICESLLNSDAFTLFATHFIELISLTKVYLNATNYHFASEIVEENLVCKYPHILLPGPTLERFYGIKLANLSGLNPTITEDSANIAKQLSLYVNLDGTCNADDDATSAAGDGTQRSTLRHAPIGTDLIGREAATEIMLNRAKYRLAARLMHLIINKQEKLDFDLIRRLQCEFEEMKQIEKL